MIEGVVLGMLSGIALITIYNRFRGCSNGHHWGEWGETGHYKIVPFHDDDTRFAFEVREVRECQHNGCHATERQWVGVTYIDAETFKKARQMFEEASEC